MTTERHSGTLERITLKPGQAHAYIRVKGILHHVCMANRGVLEEDGTIRRCEGDDRYLPIEKRTDVELDINVDAEGKRPFVVAWAPKNA